MVALIAAFQMAAKRCCVTHFDGVRDTPLLAGRRRTVLLSISFADRLSTG